MRVVAQSVSKAFGGTAALERASLTLNPGRVHALVGENGAGKSTLLKIVGGAVRPDAGRMTLDGAPYAPGSALAARAAGVALIHQELTVSPTLTVAENVFIDRPSAFARFGVVSRRRMNAAAAAVLAKLGLDIDPATPAARLDLGQMKCVEICRALAVAPSVVLLDESTAFLNRDEVRAVLGAVAALREEGLAVAFVSHHLEEVFTVADEVTVLKDGRFVAHEDRAALDASRLHELMVGRDLAQDLYPVRGPEPDGPVALTIRAARTGRAAPPFDLDLRAGEILGVAGLRQSGGDRLIRALAGDLPLAAGEIRVAGAPVAFHSPVEAWRAGVAYLPGDRTGQGLIAGFSVGDNIALAAMPHRGPFYDAAAAKALGATAVAELHIRTPGLAAPVESLSGGNMQKTLLAKCLAVRPRLLLLDNPTRGVDLGARQEIYRALRRLAEGGAAMILLSEDLAELLGLADRIATFRRGAATAVFDVRRGVTESDLVSEIV